MVDKSLLKAMYEASEQDLLYGIGLVGVEGSLPVPMIQCFYRSWSEEMLRVIAETLRSGVELSLRPDRVYLATKERIEGREYDGRDTSSLRAPAWVRPPPWSSAPGMARCPGSCSELAVAPPPHSPEGKNSRHG